MPRLSKPHHHARRRIIDLAAAGLPVDRLAAQITATLQEAIGWDGFRVFGLDQQTMLVNTLLDASENDAVARLEWLREVYLVLPTRYAELPELARSGLQGVAFQERQDECWGFPGQVLNQVAPDDHYRHFHEFRSPVGGTILAIFRHQQRPVAAMQAYRRDPNRPFRRSDVHFVQQMSGTIGAALATARDRDAALRGEVGTSTASGILLVNAAGTVQFATPATDHWLEVLGAADQGLPTAVWSALAAFRSQPAGTATTLSVPVPGGRIRVEVSAGGEAGLQAVVLSPEGPPPLPEVPIAWGLTPREAEIVEHLAQGRTNRGIAEAMFVGEHTVEWHLRTVYDKLGVNSRQEVVAALFRQAFLPAIEQETLAGVA